MRVLRSRLYEHYKAEKDAEAAEAAGEKTTEVALESIVRREAARVPHGGVPSTATWNADVLGAGRTPDGTTGGPYSRSVGAAREALAVRPS